MFFVYGRGAHLNLDVLTSPFPHGRTSDRVTTAALMAWEGAQVHRRNGDARRVLMARLVLDHRLAVQDPWKPSDTALEQRMASALLDGQAIAMAAAAPLLS